jgi:DNA-binding transcriptional MerR regulator
MGLARMRIGELSARTGASARSIRYHEQQGLLASHRTAGDQRDFDDTAIERVRLVRRLFDAGLSSVTMADLLPCITDASARTPYLTERLEAERVRILLQAEELGRTARTLQLVIDELGAADASQTTWNDRFDSPNV